MPFKTTASVVSDDDRTRRENVIVVFAAYNWIAAPRFGFYSFRLKQSSGRLFSAGFGRVIGSERRIYIIHDVPMSFNCSLYTKIKHAVRLMLVCVCVRARSACVFVCACGYFPLPHPSKLRSCVYITSYKICKTITGRTI